MPLPDDIAANLPPPRDDEPASLRRDILDELADHLRCALDREEQRQAATPEVFKVTPAKRAFERFGNPSRVAWRLWWDVMWEKVVTQRALVLCSGLIAVACCVSTLVAVRLTGAQERTMTELRITLDNQQKALLAQQRELEATLRRIGERSGPAAPAVSPSPDISALWSPVEITLSSAVPGEALPPGFTVSMGLMNDISLPLWEGKTGPTSKVSFPLVRYGRYSLHVRAPWGETTYHQGSVMPGIPMSVTIHCPAAPVSPIVVKPKLVLSEGLRNRNLAVGLSLRYARRRAADFVWTTDFRPTNRSEFLSNTMLLVSQENIRPYATADSLDPYVVYEGSVLRGVLWPGEALQPDDSLHFFVLEDVGRSSTDAKTPPDDSGMPGRPYRLATTLTLGRDLEADIRAGGDTGVKDFVIRLTAAGETRLREALLQFDSTIADLRKRNDVAYRDDYDLYPPPPQRRE